MAKGSDNLYPSILLEEAATPATPAAGSQRLFIDSTDDTLKRVNSAGTVTAIEGGPGGTSTPVGARMTVSTTKAVLAASNTKVDLNTVDFDEGGVADTTNKRFVVPEDGIYLFSAYVEFSASVTDCRVRAYVNGVDTGSVTRSDLPSSRPATGSRPYSLSAGDTVEMYVYTAGASTYSSSAWASLVKVS